MQHKTATMSSNVTDSQTAIQSTNLFKELHGYFIEDLEVGMSACIHAR